MSAPLTSQRPHTESSKGQPVPSKAVPQPPPPGGWQALEEQSAKQMLAEIAHEEAFLKSEEIRLVHREERLNELRRRHEQWMVYRVRKELAQIREWRESERLWNEAEAARLVAEQNLSAVEKTRKRVERELKEDGERAARTNAQNPQNGGRQYEWQKFAPATDAQKNGGALPRGREIYPSNVIPSEPIESPTPYGPNHRSISQTRNLLSSQADERRPVQPANPSSTPTPPKEACTGIDEATSILRRVVVTAPSAEASGRGPQSGPPFSNPHASPIETPNLTGRIVRLGSTPMARGGYSSVWRGNLISTASDGPHRTLQVALKVLHVPYTDESTVKRKLRKHLHVEMRVWAQLRHENVARLLGHTEEPEGPGLVSISYLHGDVLSFLAKNPSVNREIICVDIALGLQYLHEHKPQIIHGDLKGRNVLIDGEGRASICDFGLSIILDGGPTGYTSSNFGGTLRFLAPELLEARTRTVQTDIYGYACTCIQILFDLGPYHLLSEEAPLIRAILDPRRPPFEPSDEEVTFPSVLQVLKRCWSHDRSSRPSVDLIIDTIQRCLYRIYRRNLGIHQGIGKRIRFMCLPGVEQATLMWVDVNGLSIVVKSSTSFHQVPIYQRYCWELMENQNVEDSEDGSNPSGEDPSSSESPPHISIWMDYSVKFRLPYSSMVSYKSYHEGTS